jgi:hypothetical protein
MSTELYQKVTPDHLRRDAFLYVRQSSLRQVFENTESTKRQYALRERAVSLGWPIERVHVIDSAFVDWTYYSRITNANAGRIRICLATRLARAFGISRMTSPLCGTTGVSNRSSASVC